MSTRSGNPAKKAAATRAKNEARAKAMNEANEAVPGRKMKLFGKRARKGVMIEVLPFMDWDADWVDHMPQETALINTTAWARAVLDDTNLAKWTEAKPSNTHGLDFLNNYFEETGEDLGESSDSQES